ncbi:septal ring lytic transglycosylase RlpA family protein [Candidatus Peregrinibacteria bacterium]|nr:septal ring lytic transglycosylase RlpA family protein [Candidatus Peregrinibacteria bacterium]
MNRIRRTCLSAALSLGLFLMTQGAWATVVFTDVASDNPHYEAITALFDKGVIQGYPDHTFRPDQAVNRAEILKVILLGSDILVPEIQKQALFPDVDSEAWYGKYVSKAKNLGIVSGDSTTGLFRPGDTVNLAEALKILLKTNAVELPVPKANPYADVPTDAWFAPYFDYARLAGLLDQKPEENVSPAKPVTRGLLAELMYRLSKSDVMLSDGKASYYGALFHGKTTANGEVFDASAFTAAHRTYPFDTWLKVTNLENRKSVVVRVNDRGPYVSDPTRVIDLSQAAFESISLLSRGIIEVKIEVTTAPDSSQPTPTPTPSPTPLSADLLNATKTSCPEAKTLAFIGKNDFENITLSAPLPNRVLLSETMLIKGSTLAKTPEVNAFFVDSAGGQTSFGGPIKDGQFSISLRFPKEGTYKLGILPGESGNSIVKEIMVLRNTCIEEVESQQLLPVSNVKTTVENGDTVVRWSPGLYNLFKLTLQQGGLKKSFFLHDTTEWKPYYREFSGFKPGNVDLFVRGAKLTQNSILEPTQIVWSPATTTPFIATNHYEHTVNADEVELTSLTQNAILKETIQAIFKAKVPIRSKAAVILPNGTVEELPVTSATQTAKKNAFGIESFPASTDPLTVSYTVKETALHILEVNNVEGLAIINVPIYIRNQFPLIPNPRDLQTATPVNLGTDLPALRLKMLGLVNKDRATYGLPPLAQDDSLTRLAQYRSDDMVANNYFGHWDSQGMGANDLRKNYGIVTQVSENLAKDTTLELAEYGLMRSAIHRSNILSPDWTRVGFGITKAKDGGYLFVQIFSPDPLNMDNLDSLRNSLLSAINQNRGTALAPQSNLNTLAQTWSQRMVDENFFDFTGPSAPTLVDSIRNSGIKSALGTYIMGNSSFSDALQQASANTVLQESHWKNIGIGIKQDNLGIIKITLIYTE